MNRLTFMPGEKVRMTQAYKAKMRGDCLPGKHLDTSCFDPDMPDEGCMLCSSAHIEEFGNCIGFVAGLVNYNNVPTNHPDFDPNKFGPELNVCWQPSNLRYGYAPEDLEPAE